jgi:DNA-binding transcriptional regulator YdaS (Cro superfamily)
MAIMTTSALRAQAYVAPDADPVETPLERACRLVGSPAEMARRCGVKPQAVDKWKKRVPLERVPQIVRLTNGQVTAHELRPDYFPEGTQFAAEGGR